MHCTNGIVVQVCDKTIGVQSEPRDRAVHRKKSLSSLPNTIACYISKKRVDPSHLQNVNIEEITTSSLSKSQLMDFMWTLCYTFHPSKIPNWTGFNFLLHESGDEEEVQTVTYLPAIDQSPTKLDTVLELLLQSKAKAERLGLQDTDVVVDQAIYAKAVEVMENPTHKDLKRFIVLRLGAFHISSTFIAVIGKRFGDAGLKDLLVESDLFGKVFLLDICFSLFFCRIFYNN